MVLGVRAPWAALPASRTRPPTRRHPSLCRAPQASSERGGENPLVSLAVGAMTQGLKLAGVGAREYEAAAVAAARPAGSGSRPLRRNDMAGLLRTLRRDFDQNQYFITGVLENDAIYAEQCYFADPTVGFRGREQYKRNLALVVPFLEQPAIQLLSLRRLPPPSPAGRGRRAAAAAPPPTQLFAEWRLSCYVRLPWAPRVCINGTTTYTLSENKNQIVSHVEAWDVSAVQALLLLIKPSDRAFWRRGQQG